MRQVLDIISSRDTKAADEILGSSFHIAVTIVKRIYLVFGPAEVAVARDGGSAIELAEAFLGLRLSGGIKPVTSEEFIRRNTLLGTETGLSLGKFRIY